MSLLHELIHLVTDNDAKILELYKSAFQTIENMDNKWEEGTITGFLHLKKISVGKAINPEIYDYCCENTGLLELGQLIKVSHHGGLTVNEGEFLAQKLKANGRIDYLEKLLNLETTGRELLN